MAKKKTRVTLPGSLSDLVRDLQNGGNGSSMRNDANNNNEENNQNETKNESAQQVVNQPVAEQVEPSTNFNQVALNRQNDAENRSENRVNENAQPVGQNYAAQNEGYQRQNQPEQHENLQNGVGEQDSANRPIGTAAEGSRSYSPGRPVKQNTMKEYHIVKDDSKDSWDLFLDMAKQYKDGGGKLATIYIDGTLKNILDRMKYVGPTKLPTSAILSSIVARFIYDHEDEIRKALFSGNLF